MVIGVVLRTSAMLSSLLLLLRRVRNYNGQHQKVKFLKDLYVTEPFFEVLARKDWIVFYLP